MTIFLGKHRLAISIIAILIVVVAIGIYGVFGPVTGYADPIR
jgi:hypothetical protein